MARKNGTPSWPNSWERLSTPIGSMSQARIPVRTTKDGEVSVVGNYDCPQPDDFSQFDEFKEWAIQQLGEDGALESFLSGVMVKIAGNIRSGSANPEMNERKASKAASKLSLKGKRALLDQLKKDLSE